MKFYAPILLSFLSSSAFISSPALSMILDEHVNPPLTVPHKAKKNLTTKRRELKDFLGKQDYPAAFKSLRATTTASDAEVVNFLMTSNKYLGWDKVDPKDKTWVVAKITKAARRKDLASFLSKQDYPAAFKSLRATTTASDAEVVNFLMTSNKYPGWDKGNPEDKEWVVARITGKPIQTDLDRRTDVTKLTGKTQDFADTLKNLNPGMEVIVANAWADLVKDQDPSLMLGEHYSDEDLTYTFQRPGIPRTYLYRHLMPPHKLSGYYSLSLTPKRALLGIEAFLTAGAHGTARCLEIIAEKLIADFRRNKLPKFLRDNKEIMYLQQQVLAKEAEVAGWVEAFNAFLGRGIGIPGKEALQANDIREELFIDLPEDLPSGLTVSVGLVLLNDAKDDLAKHTAKIKDACMNDKLLLDYIAAKISPRKDILSNIKEKKEKFIITILADIMKININIYQPVKDTSHELQLAQAYVTPGAVRQVNLLYVNGHFDRLETKLHRHVVPASEFQDPFAQFRGMEASYETVTSVGLELKNIDRILFPEGDGLQKELHDLTGYGGGNKDAFIEGYLIEEARVGRYVSIVQAEAEYNNRVKTLEDKIAEGEKICMSKKIPTYIFSHLSKAFTGGTIIPQELESALGTIEVCPLPKVMYPKGIKIHNQGMVRRTILEHWDRGYVAFEVKADGLYGTKVEGADPKKFEKILKFADGKVEIVRVEDIKEGLHLFYLQDPKPEDIKILDGMLIDAKKLCPKYFDATKTLITAVKELFEMRKDLLEKALKGEYNEVFLASRSHMVHLSYSNPANRWDYDDVSAQHRLNNIHNSLVQSYLKAKSRGDDALKHYFEQTMFAPSYCLDGASRTFQDYVAKQEKGLDILEVMTKEKFIDQQLEELAKLPDAPTKDSICGAFRKFLGAPTKEGPFGEKDIDKVIERAVVLGFLEDDEV